ncbi:hypothetical protein [Bergeriella denitrificans]|uniref:Uncharacterized protein n=1 Tax=Bergeriella denitrificans TaxID=494 RepID=A0A378UGJ3_BERDE|nr:hypothetical protein [Bergeriella denitrificans]STZ75819.1 Uncharacterised protein [Bergeriella denitrificans]
MTFLIKSLLALFLTQALQSHATANRIDTNIQGRLNIESEQDRIKQEQA